ncbi:MAG: OmpA family protein [Candidatus Hydrogenedentes bacterium]|nr:OmpA family protein [Candidatus Hydrogenedentota bacterium]
MRRAHRFTCWTVAIAMVLAVGGCQTANEHRTATGAVVGTAVGAGAGALLDKDNPGRGALIGAAVGGAVGAGVGHMLKRQKEAFDRIENVEAQQETVILSQPVPPPAEGEPAPAPQGEEKPALRVSIQSEVLFTVGSSALSPAGAAKMKEVAAILKEYPESDCYIQGHTSSEGDDKANFELSQRRAEVVRNELVANGVAASRLYAMGMGSSKPVGDNNTESGRVMNRRVEIHIVPHETEAAQQ